MTRPMCRPRWRSPTGARRSSATRASSRWSIARTPPHAAFFGGQTLNKPKKYNLPAASANAELSARLPYILNASRFAHYIKVIAMRDRIGSFMTKENVQTYPTTWISDYVLAKDDAGQDLKARYPLREARIDVTGHPRSPRASTTPPSSCGRTSSLRGPTAPCGWSPNCRPAA